MKRLTHRSLWIALLCLMLTFSLLLSGCQNPTPPDEGSENEQTPPEGNQPGSGNQDDPNKEEQGFMKDGYVNLTDKGNSLYDATYQTMLDRLMQDGYAQTSLTGAYNGMFVRDASIQIMAHVAQGDLNAAKRILQYMAAYHKAYGAEYALHIMNPLSDDRLFDYVVGEKEIFKPGSGSTSQSVSQMDNSAGLYLIGLPNNQAAQQFTVPFDSISDITVALEIGAHRGKLKLMLGTETGDDSLGTVELDISKLDRSSKWTKFTFEEPVKVTPGQTYYFTVAAVDADNNVVAYGKAGGGGAYNYDVKTFGGWWKEAHSLGYDIRADISIVGEDNAASQQFVAPGDRIDAIDINLQCEEETTVYAKLTDASGKEIKRVSAAAKTGTVTLDFGVKVTEGENYTLTVWAESGRTAWNLTTTPAGKESHAMIISPEYSGSKTAEFVTVGGKVVATQYLPNTLNNLYVTSAALYLASTGTAGENDTFTVSLYKGDVLVDEQTMPVSMLSDVSVSYYFEFCLPIKATKAGDEYSIRLSASKEGSVNWFGTATPNSQTPTMLNGETKQMLLSYTVGVSNVVPISKSIQVDGHYMWMNAFAMFALEANKAGNEYDEFIRDVYPFMVAYSQYFFEAEGYINEKTGLMYNPCYEHSRHGDYWKAYDLITNVFTSEAAHKMSEVAKLYGNSTESTYFADAADAVAEAVHEHLICDFAGKTIYTELIGKRVNGAEHSGYSGTTEDGLYIYKGFSFVSLAPLAADWYAMDAEIMKNTYEAYCNVGTDRYGKYKVLGVVVEPNATENGSVYIGNHVIGKGLAWELFYLWKTGNVERLEHLVNFVYDKSTDVYPEVWRKDGSVSDSANQEHANWILYSFARITGKYKG